MSLWIGSSLLKLSFFLASYHIMLLHRAACAVGFKLGLLLVAAIMIGATVAGSSDKDKDKEECIQQVAVLATCLPYVGGEAKAPTPDCCSGLKQVLKNNKKCLCVIIRDRNDPDLGVNINVTLALSLPTVCNAPANVSKCPELLHMDPNSPEAQVFYQFSKGSNGGAESPAASSSSTAGNPISSESEGANNTQKGDGCRSSTSIGIMEIAIGCGLLLWQWHFLPFQFFI